MMWITADRDDKDNGMPDFTWRSSARACMFDLKPKVGEPGLWPSMVPSHE